MVSLSGHRQNARLRHLCHLLDFGDRVTDQTELRLDLSENSRDNWPSGHCYLELKLPSIFEEHLRPSVVACLHGKVRYSHRVVPVQESGVYLLLGRLESTTGKVRLANSLYLGKAELIAVLVQGVVNAV